MKPVTRMAEAAWKGNLDQGHGLVTTESETLLESPFLFTKRIDQADRSVTNPEELIAAALASCFSMALSKTLQDDEAVAQKLVVRADITLDVTDAGPKINKLKLDVEGQVSGYTEKQFEQAVATTRKNCPVIKLLEPGLETIDMTVRLGN